MKYINTNLLLSLLAAFLLLPACVEKHIRYENVYSGKEKDEASVSPRSLVLRFPGAEVDKDLFAAGTKAAAYNLNIRKQYALTAAKNAETFVLEGDASWEPGDHFTVFTPYRADTCTIQEMLEISMPHEFAQAGSEPTEAAMAIPFMGTGIVAQDGQLSVDLKPLSAQILLNISNTTPEKLDFQMDSLLFLCSENVFPKKMVFDKAGKPERFMTEQADSCISVDLKDQTLAADASMRVLLPILPTTNGETILVNEDARLSVKLKCFLNGEAKDFTIYDGKIQEAPFTGLAEANGNFFVGRVYELDYPLFYEIIPAAGYKVEEVEGNKEVYLYNAKGLMGFAALLNADNVDPALLTAKVRFDSSIAGQTIDMSGLDWTPIQDFSGDWDAEGTVIENLNILPTGDNAGFIIQSKGSLKNFIIKNARSQGAANASLFVTMLKGGVIENTKIIGGELESVGGVTGGLFARGDKGQLRNSSVEGAAHITAASGAVGGLAGMALGSVDIQGCHVGAEVIVTEAKAAQIGGLIGQYGSKALLTGSYSLATVVVEAGSGFIGGLVGQLVAAGQQITACYAAGSIQLAEEVSGSSVGGLLGGRWSGPREWFVFKAVYCSVDIPNPPAGNSVGAMQGKVMSARDNLQYSEAAYYTQEGLPDCGLGGRRARGMVKVTPEELQQKVSELNALIQSTGFSFTQEGTQGREYLKLKKL